MYQFDRYSLTKDSILIQNCDRLKYGAVGQIHRTLTNAVIHFNQYNTKLYLILS